MINKRPLILITNDDGDYAKGINELTRLMMELGDVVVMAPDGPRSGQSNALTVTQPIRFYKAEESEGLVRYICSGTPTDCVKIALNEVLDRKPDLLVSGINHGSNAAINVIYSGTMGAAFEGCTNGIPSIGFSICNFSPNADFSVFESFILKIAKDVLVNGLPNGICLNVNAPANEIKGVKMTKQCDGYWAQEFAQGTDPRGQGYYWLTGHFYNNEATSQDTDEWALAHDYISIVPTKVDMTAYDVMDDLKQRFE